ncbi:type II toxin-antitoxin system RelE/ParE family toxin [Actinoplanes rectilineatus]|uniref:type II toxin-antitoxin system RelE/ParE family toxin n=1 Tax=Actinoplanes rectilineatus TaxID=113571 RepID=UPI000B141E6A|nr:type II toxin-antitoxin system RelE/ParE family toxin [Actinoplanes rectilineatus]
MVPRVCETDPVSADQIAEAIEVLVERGPALGRPLVDRLKGSAYHNMKELRTASTGQSELRLIFAFDPARQAIFLVAGDKSGQWQEWYEAAIPLADARFTEHPKRLGKEGER